MTPCGLTTFGRSDSAQVSVQQRDANLGHLLAKAFGTSPTFANIRQMWATRPS